MKEFPSRRKSPRDWENPEVFQINREAPHATLISFPDEQSALEAINAKFTGLYFA